MDGYNELNIIRQHYGLRSMSINPSLQDAAQKKAEFLAHRGQNCRLEHNVYDNPGNEVLYMIAGGGGSGISGHASQSSRRGLKAFLSEGVQRGPNGRVNVNHAAIVLWDRAVSIGCGLAIGAHSDPRFRNCQVFACKYSIFIFFTRPLSLIPSNFIKVKLIQTTVL
jgi:hypothetical protein